MSHGGHSVYREVTTASSKGPQMGAEGGAGQWLTGLSCCPPDVSGKPLPCCHAKPGLPREGGSPTHPVTGASLGPSQLQGQDTPHIDVVDPSAAPPHQGLSFPSSLQHSKHSCHCHLERLSLRAWLLLEMTTVPSPGGNLELHVSQAPGGSGMVALRGLQGSFPQGQLSMPVP